MTHSLRRLLEVTLLMVRRDFRGRYKHTSVGIFWSLIHPLLFLGVFYLLFQLVLEIDIPHYASFVFIGILGWNWCQASLNSAVSSISSNPGLVGQPGYPVKSLPIVSTIASLVNISLSVPVLVLLLVLEGAQPSLSLAALPLILVTQLILILAIAFFLAASNVHFRDIEHILPIMLQLGYYVTPIFYDAARIAPEYRWVLQLNPMYHIIYAYRSILILGEAPAWIPILLIAFGSSLLLWLSHAYFERARYRFLEEL